MTSLAGLPTLNPGKAEARPAEEDEVVEDIDENYSDEDFERGDDALLNSSILDSKPKPVRNAEGGGRTLSSGNK